MGPCHAVTNSPITKDRRADFTGTHRDDRPEGSGMIFKNNPRSARIATLLRVLLTSAATFSLSACDPIDGSEPKKAVDATASSPESISVTSVNLGKWSVSDHSDPMTDKRYVKLALRAEQGDVSLNVFCNGGWSWVDVDWNAYLGGQRHSDLGVAEITYRIGDSQQSQANWDLLKDQTTSRLSDGVTSFVERLQKTNKLVLQTAPYLSNPKTAIFDTTGLREVLKSKRPACDAYLADLVRAERDDWYRLQKERARKEQSEPTAKADPKPPRPWPAPAEDALIK